MNCFGDVSAESQVEGISLAQINPEEFQYRPLNALTGSTT